MSKAWSKALRATLAEELRGLARVLQDENVVRDASVLTQAGDNCKLHTPNNREHYWSYDINSLTIGPIVLADNGYRKSRPRNLEKIFIELNANLKGLCLQTQDTSDPFTEMVVNIEILGETTNGDLLSCAMHLDRQPEASTDEEHPLFAHPSYHFHFGGKKMIDKDDAQFGNNLLLESPRLAHPPMDGILAVDFILSNYLPSIWRHLRHTNAQYQAIVKSAQKRYWRPYAIATVLHWEQMPFPTQWPADIVWPHLFK